MTVRWTDKPGGRKLVSASHGLELREESMSKDYTYTSQILGRDIERLENVKLQRVMRAYTRQCVAMLERELEKYGGLQTLRIRYVEHRRDIDFIGTSGGEPTATAWPDPCPRCGGELLPGHTWLSSAHVCL